MATLKVNVLANAAEAEAIFAQKLPVALDKFRRTVAYTAEKNVAAMELQIIKSRELLAATQAIASGSVAGSTRQIAANTLVANSMRKLGIETRTTSQLMDTITKRSILLGRSMTMYLTLPIAAAGAIATKMFINFQRQMEMIHTQAGAPQGEVNRQTRNILNFAKAPGGSPIAPEQLATGLFHLESIGLRGKEALDALKISAQAAGLGIANLEDVTTALGGAMVTGIKGTENANKAMGIINATVGAGNMHLQDYAASLRTGVMPAAKDMGLSMAEVGAALDVLTDRGMGAQMAATRLRMSFSMMEDPTNLAKQALAELGIQADQLAKLMRSGPNGMTQALELVQAGMDRMTNKVKASQDVLDAFGKGRSGAGILTLLNSLSSTTSSFQGKLAQIEASQKQFAENVAAYHKTASYQISHAWAAIQSSMISAGGAIAPYVVNMAKALQGLVGWFDKLSPAVKHVIGYGVLLFATLGPVLLIVGKIGRAFIDLGVIVKSVAKIFAGSAAAEIVAEDGVTASVVATETAVGGLKTALMGLGSAAVLGPLALAAAGVYAIVHGFDSASKHLQSVQVKGGLLTRDTQTGTYSFRPSTANRGSTRPHAVSAAEAAQMLAAAGKSFPSSPPPSGSGIDYMANLNRNSGAFNTRYSAGSLSGVSLTGENAMISQALNALANKGYNVRVTSGYRTYDQQAALYARYVSSGFNRKYIAAKPGHSNHESGNAVDVYVNGKPVDQSPGALAILKKFGLVSDVPGDHEHLDLVGYGTGPINAQNNPMTDALNKSIPRDAKAKAAAAKRAAAAAKKAADAAAKGIIDPINETMKEITTAIAAETKEGKTPVQIIKTIKGQISTIHKSLGKLEREFDHGSKEEQSKLQVEINKLKLADTRANAALIAEKDAQANIIAKSMQTKDTAQFKKFSANYNLLQKLTGMTIPGVTTDYLAVISGTLDKEQKVLTQETVAARGKLASASLKTKATYQKIVDGLVADQATLDSEIEANMEANIAVLQTKYATALTSFETSWGNIVSEITDQFDKQTQDYITNVLGPQFFQNGLLTPSEQELANLQDTMSNDQLVNTVNDARQSLISDISSGAGGVKIKQDQAMIKADEDAFKAAALQVKATKERTAADQAYARATQQYADAQIVKERQMVDALEVLKKNIENGSASLSDLDGLMATYGVTLSGVDAQLYGIDYPMANGALTTLTTTTANLQTAFDALIAWINAHTGSTVSTTTSTTTTGGGGTSPYDAAYYATSPLSSPQGTTPLPIGGNDRVGGKIGGRMASGGVVMGPTYAMIGEGGPEAVIPLSRLGGGSNDEIHIHFDGPVIGTGLAKAAQELEPHIRAALYRTKRSNVSLNFG